MTLLEAKVEALLKELKLTVYEESGRFAVYRESHDRYSNERYLHRVIVKEPTK